MLNKLIHLINRQYLCEKYLKPVTIQYSPAGRIDTDSLCALGAVCQCSLRLPPHWAVNINISFTMNNCDAHLINALIHLLKYTYCMNTFSELVKCKNALLSRTYLTNTLN